MFPALSILMVFEYAKSQLVQSAEQIHIHLYLRCRRPTILILHLKVVDRLTWNLGILVSVVPPSSTGAGINKSRLELDPQDQQSPLSHQPVETAGHCPSAIFVQRPTRQESRSEERGVISQPYAGHTIASSFHLCHRVRVSDHRRITQSPSAGLTYL